MKFIQMQSGCKFEFFYHCWKLEENQPYSHSPWRKIDKSTLIYKEKILAELQALYNPVLCEIENQNNVVFEQSLYENTIAFNNTTGLKRQNINNTLFQMYSRNKARNLLNTHLLASASSEVSPYDFVIAVRFDVGEMPSIYLNKLDKSKIYVSNTLCPRKIIPDVCIISPVKTYLEWATVYDSLKDLLDNKELSDKIADFKERLLINPEELTFAKYIFHYGNTDNVRYFQGGNL
jgi:hypothetical protein